jgi:protein-tyrosine-phosphatase
MTDDRIELTTEETMLIRQGAERLRHLFLCVHNAGRSQMGAGWLRHLAGDRVDVFSGGIRDDVRNRVEALVASLGLDVAAADGQR